MKDRQRESRYETQKARSRVWLGAHLDPDGVAYKHFLLMGSSSVNKALVVKEKIASYVIYP